MGTRSREEQMAIGKRRAVIRRGLGEATVVGGAKKWVDWMIRGEIDPQQLREELCSTKATENLTWVNDFF